MGLVERSSVSAFLDKYYEEHPLDNSFEGVIARRSGLTKNAVSKVSDYLEVVDFVATYDPVELLPAMQQKDSNERIIFSIDEPIRPNPIVILTRYVKFDSRKTTDTIINTTRQTGGLLRGYKPRY